MTERDKPDEPSIEEMFLKKMQRRKNRLRGYELNQAINKEHHERKFGKPEDYVEVEEL